MSFSIGLDIGGSKIAGAVFDQTNQEISRARRDTPKDYSVLVTTCKDIVAELERACGGGASIGVGVPGSVDQETGIIPVASNTPCLSGRPLKTDLEKALGRQVQLANDADCAALSEAKDGAGAGYDAVLGLIMGTGVGGGFVYKGQLVTGANGMVGEFAHVSLPFRDAKDGPLHECVCGLKDCVEKSISGSGLATLYESMTNRQLKPEDIAHAARNNDADALRVLDQFYTTVAKAMHVIFRTFDADVIVVSGGLSELPGMYETVPQRWKNYPMAPRHSHFVPAKHGPMSGLRGAAWIGRLAMEVRERWQPAEPV